MKKTFGTIRLALELQTGHTWIVSKVQRMATNKQKYSSQFLTSIVLVSGMVFTQFAVPIEISQVYLEPTVIKNSSIESLREQRLSQGIWTLFWSSKKPLKMMWPRFL